MPTLAERVAVLRRCGRAAREAALLEAIVWAGDNEADPLAVELLECARTSRDPQRGLISALSAWPRLGTLVRDAVLSAAGDDLDDLLRAMLRAEQTLTRSAAAWIACDLLIGPRPPTADRRRVVGTALQTLVIDADESVALAARDAVCRTCDYLAESPDNHAAAPLEDPLEKALVAALTGYVEHRHTGTIQSVLRARARPAADRKSVV